MAISDLKTPYSILELDSFFAKKNLSRKLKILNSVSRLLILLQDMNERKILRQLNAKLESLAYLIPVPLVIYFTTIAGVISEFTDILYVILSGSLAGFTVLMTGLIWRILFFRQQIQRIRIHLENPDSEKFLKEAIRAKINLLRLPYYEGISVVLKWLVGLPMAHLLFVLFQRPLPEAHWTVPVVLPTVIPISFVLFLFITENTLRPLLESEEIRNIKVPLKYIGISNAFARITLVNFSLVILPSAILGYMLYLKMSGRFEVENLAFHIILIIVFASIAIFIASYSVAKGIKLGLESIKKPLVRLGQGDFKVSCAVCSSDEFGEQAYHTEEVIEQLRSFYNEIRELNENLEAKVIERTKELQESLEQIKQLKIQQDGDYFLTSLLLNPLSVNKARQATVMVDFVLKQKKEFEFRSRKQEIGGDLCLAHSLELENRNFTFFLNADAMGKSMQGAGGALILGSVTHTLIEKAKENPSQHAKSWLKQAFIDLHKIFETFNGSMLVSLVMGLVDEESGTLYYLNAEHPWIVLYRDKKAEFIEKELLYRKLGTTGMEGKLEVQTFQMKPGDVLFAGSDGKDDILFRSENGFVLNEDEKLFLEIVEKSDGILSNILQEIYNHAEIKDDLSILRISFKENITDLNRSNSQRLSRLMQLAKSQLVEGNYEEALDTLEEAHLIDPKRADIIKSRFRVLVKLGEYTKAIEVGQRYIHLVPDDSRFLQQLAICFKKSGDLNSYKQYAEKAKEIQSPLS